MQRPFPPLYIGPIRCGEWWQKVSILFANLEGDERLMKQKQTRSGLLGLLALCALSFSLVMPLPADAQMLKKQKIFDALEDNNLTTFRQALLEGHSPNLRSDEGEPVIVVAAALNRLYLMDVLFEHGGVNVDASIRKTRETALMVASENGYLEVMELLIEKGADLDAEDRRGETPLIKAVRAGELSAVQLLIDEGAEPNQTDYTGRSAYAHAEESRQRGILNYLAGIGATY